MGDIIISIGRAFVRAAAKYLLWTVAGVTAVVGVVVLVVVMVAGK